jgi:hypothetical protein
VKQGDVCYYTDGQQSYLALVLRDLGGDKLNLLVYMDDKPNPYTMAKGHANFLHEVRLQEKPDKDGDFRADTWHKEAFVKPQPKPGETPAKTPTPVADSELV